MPIKLWCRRLGSVGFHCALCAVKPTNRMHLDDKAVTAFNKQQMPAAYWHFKYCLKIYVNFMSHDLSRLRLRWRSTVQPLSLFGMLRCRSTVQPLSLFGMLWCRSIVQQLSLPCILKCRSTVQPLWLSDKLRCRSTVQQISQSGMLRWCWTV